MVIENEEFLSVNDLAKMLKVSKSFIYKCIKAGKFNGLYIKFGGKYLFRISKIDSLLFGEHKSNKEKIEELMIQLLTNVNNLPPDLFN